MFRRLPVFGADQRGVAEIVNNIMDGKTNNTGTITLATGNATSTTLYDARISPESKIILIPFSSAAFNDTAPYGEFRNDTDQLAPGVGTTATVEWGVTEESNGVYASNTTRINVRNAGTYQVKYSLQLQNANNDGQYADVWIRKNGTDIDNTGRRYYLPPRKSATDFSHVVGVAEYVLTLAAGDYIEVAGSVSSTDVTLEHFASDGAIPRPAIPAATLSVQFIAPLAYSNVYVSAQQNGQATISHYANSTSDKTYAYIIIG
jgi:hypothetical protein